MAIPDAPSEYVSPEEETFRYAFYHIADLTLVYLSVFNVYAFSKRYRRKQHIVTLMGLIGAIVCLVGVFPRKLLHFGESFRKEVCLMPGYVPLYVSFPPITAMFMFAHLLFKARLVSIDGDICGWTKTQIVAAILIWTVPAMMFAVLATTWMIYDETLWTKCEFLTTDKLIGLFYGATLVINSVLSSLLFFNGILRLLAFDQTSLGSRWIRTKEVWLLIFCSKFSHTLFPPSTNPSSITFDNSKKQLLLLGRRAFLAMVLNTVVTTVILATYAIPEVSWAVTGTYHVESAISLALAILASPLPQESGDEPSVASTYGTPRNLTSDRTSSGQQQLQLPSHVRNGRRSRPLYPYKYDDRFPSVPSDDYPLTPKMLSPELSCSSTSGAAFRLMDGKYK